MILLLSELKRIIREKLIEEGKQTRYTIIRGKKVPYGSSKHLNELEKTLEKINGLKERQKRGSAARTDIARVASRLKNEIQKVKNYRDKLDK